MVGILVELRRGAISPFILFGGILCLAIAFIPLRSHSKSEESGSTLGRGDEGAEDAAARYMRFGVILAGIGLLLVGLISVSSQDAMVYVQVAVAVIGLGGALLLVVRAVRLSRRE